MVSSGRAVVTAGTGGIGLETARGLAQRGFEVTVVGRDQRRGERAVANLGEPGSAPARFLRADLSSLQEVRSLGASLVAEGPLDLLVNNLGGLYRSRWTTVDGIEATFAVTHLSPYLLTEALLPALAAAPSSRIVNVTSGAVQFAGRPDFTVAEEPGRYVAFPAYGRAKLANLAYTLDLAARLDGTSTSVFAADPGGAATDMTGAMTPDMVPMPMRLLWPLIKRSVAGDPAKAARSSVYAASDTSLAGTNGVLIDSRVRRAEPHKNARDPRTAAAVLDLSRLLAPATVV
jgi:NAD(P)-dependent dehydrogenase (short-subunit alcohol dehydrogenase family)